MPETRCCFREPLCSVIVLIITITGSASTYAQGTGPDVIVGQLNGIQNYLSVDTPNGVFEAFSVGTTSCNIGDETLEWQPNTNLHPVIGQNLYKLRDGVLIQIGQSWLKHGFCALSQTLCGPCAATPCENLGVGCSDPYTAARNGTQATLGPRSQVNPSTGVFPYPFTAATPAPGIGRRLQVPVALLEPSGPGTLYFVDGQYVTYDDTQAGNHMNNVSVCAITMTGSGESYTALLNPFQTVTERTVIEHWATLDPTVELQSILVDGGSGRVWIASKVVAQQGTFRYAYAIYNENSHDSVGRFAVDLPAGITIDLSDPFHAVHHHSGLGPTDVPGSDPSYAPAGDSGYTNEPWNVTELPGAEVRWETPSTSAPANPIRWGTMYNFEFVTNAPPTLGEATLTTWRNGVEHTLVVPVPDPNFTPAVLDLSCSYDIVSNATSLTWATGGSYDLIEIRRDDELLATLPGDAVGFLDALSEVGDYVYRVTGVTGGLASATVSCGVTIEPTTLDFVLAVAPATLAYSPESGSGTVDTVITLVEDPDNVGFPHAVEALSVAFGFDEESLAITGVECGPGLAELEPDYVDVQLHPTTSGVTIAVVIDFVSTPPLLVASSSVQLFTVSIATGTAPEPGPSPIDFVDGVHGAPPIDNWLNVNLESHQPCLSSGSITLIAVSGGSFRRGDADGNGGLDLSDPVRALGHIASGSAVPCVAALDVNDDGQLSLEDPIDLLHHLFLSGPAPAAPHLTCGVDPTPDPLGCVDSLCDD